MPVHVATESTTTLPFRDTFFNAQSSFFGLSPGSLNLFKVCKSSQNSPEAVTCAPPGGVTDMETVWEGPGEPVFLRVLLIILSGSPWQSPVPH